MPLQPKKCDVLLGDRAFVRDAQEKVTTDDLLASHGRKYGISRTIVAEAAKQARALPAVVTDAAELTETRKQSGDVLEIAIPRHAERVQSLEGLFRACQVDAEEWEVESWTAKAYQGYAKNDAGQILAEQLYSITARFKARRPVMAAKQILAELLERTKAEMPAYRPLRRPGTVRSGLVYEPGIPDAHFGKLCWAAETGTDYDLKIARQLFDTAVDDLLDRVRDQRLERILWVMGNDGMNADNLEGNTTKGTRQDNDSRYFKVFGEALDAHICAIERMATLADVDVILVPGNHDHLSSFCLAMAVACRFHRAPNVQVDAGPNLHKYRQHGKVLLGFTRGDKGKLKDLPLRMLREYPQASDCRFFEWHTGDKHQVRLEEFQGVRVRILPSLCGTDAWHAGQGYTNNIRSAEGYLWDREAGLVAQYTHTVLT